MSCQHGYHGPTNHSGHKTVDRVVVFDFQFELLRGAASMVTTIQLTTPVRSSILAPVPAAKCSAFAGGVEAKHAPPKGFSYQKQCHLKIDWFVFSGLLCPWGGGLSTLLYYISLLWIAKIVDNYVRCTISASLDVKLLRKKFQKRRDLLWADLWRERGTGRIFLQSQLS